MGNVDDNFYLSVRDNENWRITYWFSFIELPPYSSARSELIVTIPENALPCTRDNITITATSWDNAVSDSDSCIAHRAKAEFRLVTLYKAGLDVDTYLEMGSKLIVRFYTYANTYQGENVVWAGSTPANVNLLENVPHPENKAVENAWLVLADEENNVIQVVARWTVKRGDLMMRLGEMDRRWPMASPEERSELMVEYGAIDRQWPRAPE
jgi:hypothetical protein